MDNVANDNIIDSKKSYIHLFKVYQNFRENHTTKGKFSAPENKELLTALSKTFKGLFE